MEKIMANINSIIAAASLNGNQYKTLDSAVQTLTNLHLAPVDVAAAAAGVQNATNAYDAAGAGINAAKAGLALVETAIMAMVMFSRLSIPVKASRAN